VLEKQKVAGLKLIEAARRRKGLAIQPGPPAETEKDGNRMYAMIGVWVISAIIVIGGGSWVLYELSKVLNK